MAKRFDGLGDPTDRSVAGTWARVVLYVAFHYGCATTATLPNDTSLPTLTYRDDSLITDAVLAEAAQYKIPGYISIPTDPVTLRNAIYLYEALSSAMIIGDEFWTPDEMPKDIDPLRVPANPVGGHQLTPCGWDSPNLDILRNSWGTAWDESGEGHYDPSLWQPFITDAWAIAEVPADVAGFLQMLPAPSTFSYQWNNDLAFGAQNNDIGMAQVAYMILGLLKPIQPSEFGIFGPKTAAANYAYQCSKGIKNPAPHNIGPQTRAALNAQFASTVN
jgi:hypothetical protein